MLEIKHLSSQITSTPPGRRKNSQRSCLVLLPLSPKLVLTHSPFICQRGSIHPVFHSMIEPTTPNSFPGQNSFPDPPVIIDGELKYEISSILDSKIDKQHKRKLQYLVQWTGYEGTDEETSWLPASELPHASKLISDFYQAYPNPDPCLPLSSIYLELHTFLTCSFWLISSLIHFIFFEQILLIQPLPFYITLLQSLLPFPSLF